MWTSRTVLYALAILLAFASTSDASEFSRLRDSFGNWQVRHVYDENTLHYRFSDAKTFLIFGERGRLPMQINRTSKGKFEFRFRYGFGRWGDRGVLGGWVTRVAIAIDDEKFSLRHDDPSFKVHEFVATVGTKFLQKFADAKSPAFVQIFVGDKFAGTAVLPVKGSSAALRWLRATRSIDKPNSKKR